jgi:hypothetical protein
MDPALRGSRRVVQQWAVDLIAIGQHVLEQGDQSCPILKAMGLATGQMLDLTPPRRLPITLRFDP